jgi:hypothetical protein
MIAVIGGKITTLPPPIERFHPDEYPPERVRLGEGVNGRVTMLRGCPFPSERVRVFPVSVRRWSSVSSLTIAD